jgi:hypothetical protein
LEGFLALLLLLCQLLLTLGFFRPPFLVLLLEFGAFFFKRHPHFYVLAAALWHRFGVELPGAHGFHRFAIGVWVAARFAQANVSDSPIWGNIVGDFGLPFGAAIFRLWTLEANQLGILLDGGWRRAAD